MKFYHFILLNLLFNTLISAQSFKYRKRNFEWSTEKPVSIKLDDSFLSEDAVILEEKCIFNEGGNRVPEYTFLNYSANYAFFDRSVQGVNPIVQKHLRIKFLTQIGIDKYTKFILPESFDPSSDNYNIRPQWRDSILRPLGEFECIRYFAARIIKPDGSIIKAIVDESTYEEIFNSITFTKKYYKWIFQINNIEVGDELELDYSYEGVYNYGYSNRIFFHDRIPIQKLDFTFRFPMRDLYIMSYHNGAYPVDSIMVTPSTPHYTEYMFQMNNLKGCINETGSRPYKQLPFITFYKHDMNFGIADPKTNFIKTPLPYPWSFAMLPTVGYKYEDLNLRLSRMDHTTRILNTYAETLRKNAGDTAAAFIISELQHDLAENFDFKEDPGYYHGEKNDLEKLGSNVENNVLRQMSRIRLYDEIMMRLDRPYYHSLLTDKRISEIDINRYEPIIASRVSIAVPYNDFILNYYPKSYRFGYEANELPFYYEDIFSFLSPQFEKAEKKYELVPLVKFKFIKTPSSSQNDNFRNTACKLSISLDSLKINVQSKIQLTGQFSTLTRGYYLYGSVDTTINPAYYKIIANTADQPLATKMNVTPVDKKYPFEVMVNQEFSTNNRLKKVNDKEFSIKLEDWFNNITDEDFQAKNRYLDYYPDFQSQDIHRYLFHFDHPVEVTNIQTFQKKINNSFTDYEINASQPGPQDVLLECTYVVKPVSVPASNAKDVENVFNAIHEINASVLSIRKTD